MSVSLKYGRQGTFSWDIDPNRVVVQHDGPGPCSGFANKVRKALTTPLDFPSLVQVCVPGDRVVVALDRHTPCSAELIAGIWHMLEQRGIVATEFQILQP